MSFSDYLRKKNIPNYLVETLVILADMNLGRYATDLKESHNLNRHQPLDLMALTYIDTLAQRMWEDGQEWYQRSKNLYVGVLEDTVFKLFWELGNRKYKSTICSKILIPAGSSNGDFNVYPQNTRKIIFNEDYVQIFGSQIEQNIHSILGRIKLGTNGQKEGFSICDAVRMAKEKYTAI